MVNIHLVIIIPYALDVIKLFTKKKIYLKTRIIMNHEYMLEIIFAYIDQGRIWLNIMLTCKSWYKIAKKVFDPSLDMERSLVYASSRGLITSINNLLNDDRIIKHSKFWYYGTMALFSVCETGRADIFVRLMQFPLIDPSYENNKALFLADKFKRVDLVRMLLIDTRINSPIDKKLFAAVKYGFSDIIRKLIKHPEFNPNDEDVSYFKLASECGKTEIVQILLDAGVNPNVLHKLDLLDICQLGHVEILKLLLNNPTFDRYKFSDLHLHSAIKCGHIEIVKLLIKHVDIDLFENNNLALWYANHYEQSKIAKVLTNKINRP